MQPRHKNENKVNECGLEETLYFQAFQISGFHLHANYTEAPKLRRESNLEMGKVFWSCELLVCTYLFL